MKLVSSTAVALALSIASAAAQTIVYVVRHAEKADVDRSHKDPGLSQAGRARAEALAHLLRDAGIGAIYATEFKRTQETAAPLAKMLGIEITVVSAAASDALIAKLKTGSWNALVVGHSNSMPEILKALGIPAPPAIAETDYDNLFAVARCETPQLLRLRYH